MKKQIKILLTLLLVLSLSWACRKIEIGYLSDHLDYGNPLFTVPAGSDYVGPAIRADGSTLPLNVELLEMRNSATGEVANDLLESRPIKVWKKIYDYETDTTEALVEAKLELRDMPAFELNSTSGKMRFNSNTRFATGTEYEYDLRISNVNGTKDYQNIGKFAIVPMKPVNYLSSTRIQVKEASSGSTPYSYMESMDNHLNGTSEINTITKISDETAPGVTVKLSVVDKNGVPFSFANGEVFGNWPGYNLPSLDVSSVNTRFDGDAILYYFPVTPFPYYSWYNQFYMYYHIIPDAVGAIDIAEYDPEKSYWLNFRINLQINEPGTWEIKIIYPNASHK